MKAIIGKKVGMSEIFDENGKVIPVTVIEAGPCVVVQKKTAEKEGYAAVQLGYEDIPERKLTKPEMGHLNKAGVAPKKYLREFNLENAAELNVGDIIKADTFKEGDFVDVTGITVVGERINPTGSAHSHEPRRRPCAPSCRFHGLHHRPQPYLQGQDRRRPDGRRPDHHPESGHRQGGSRAEPDCCPRRCSRLQGRSGADQEHCQDPPRQAR